MAGESERRSIMTVVAFALFVGGACMAAAALANARVGPEPGLGLDVNLAPRLSIVLFFWLAGGCWMLGAVLGLFGVYSGKGGALAVLLNLAPLLAIVGYLQHSRPAAPGELGARCVTDKDCWAPTECRPHPKLASRYVCSVKPTPRFPIGQEPVVPTAAPPASDSAAPAASSAPAASGSAPPAASDSAPAASSSAPAASASASASAARSATPPPAPRPPPPPPRPRPTATATASATAEPTATAPTVPTPAPQDPSPSP